MCIYTNEMKTSQEFPHGSAAAVLFSSSHAHTAMEIKRLTLSTPSLTELHHESSFSPLYITPPPPSSPYWFWATKGYVCERGSPVFSTRALLRAMYNMHSLLLHHAELALSIYYTYFECARVCSVCDTGRKGERRPENFRRTPADRKGLVYISLLSLTLSQSIRTLSAAWMLLFQYVIHHATFGSIKLLVIQESWGLIIRSVNHSCCCSREPLSRAGNQSTCLKERCFAGEAVWVVSLGDN